MRLNLSYITYIMKKSQKKVNIVSSMERIEELHWSQRLLNSLAQRDNAVLDQLAAINRNIRVLVENQFSHNLEMTTLVKKVIRKQERIIANTEPVRTGNEFMRNDSIENSESCRDRLAEERQLRSECISTQTISARLNNSEPNLLVKPASELQTQVTPFALLPETSHKKQTNQPPMTSKPKTQIPTLPNRLAVVNFEQKQLIFSIHNYLKPTSTLDLASAKAALTQWSSQLFHTLSKQTFTAYQTKHLSQTESKVYFNYNLGLNFASMIEFFHAEHRWLWDEQREELVRHFQGSSDKALEYLMVKYPQKRKGVVTEEIRGAVPAVDESEDPGFDVLANNKVFFKYSPERKGYARTVKMFLNSLVLECRKNMGTFRKAMKEIFTVGSDRGEPVELKNLIGMKFKEDTPLFSKAQIEEQGLIIRTPELLRVVIKWIAELEKRIKGIANGSKLHNCYPIKNDDEHPYEYLSRFQKQDLKDFMLQKQPLLKRAAQQIRLRIRSIQTSFPDFLTLYSSLFSPLKQSQVKVNLLSLVLSQAASNFATNYLLMLIDVLQTAAYKIKRGQGQTQIVTEDKEGNKFVQMVTFRDVQLVGFTVSDLLRCKCSGTLEEIKEVYGRLTGSGLFTVYRVKNRIDTCNRDFLVNVRMNGTRLLCEVQLAIVDEGANQKEKYLSGFCHFLYELARASHGAVTEALLLNSHFTDFKPYFDSQISKISSKQKELVFNHAKVAINAQGQLSIEGFRRRGNNFTFICSNCTQFRIAYQTHLDTFDSSQSVFDHDPIQPCAPLTKYILCGNCVLASLNYQQQSLYLLGRVYYSVFEILTNSSSQYPPLIIAIERNAPVRKLRLLQRVVHLGTQWYVPVFYEVRKDRKRMDVRTLRGKFYLFGLKENVRVEVVGRERFLEAVGVGGEEEERMFDIGGLQKYQSDSIRQRKIITPIISIEKLRNSDITNLQLLIPQNSPWLLIVNSHHSDEQLTKLTRKGRQLKDVEAKVLQKNKIWRIQTSDLDDSSFSLFVDPLPNVLEIHMAHNCITSISFVKCPSLKFLDLSDNEVESLVLNQEDFPQLESIQLTQNKLKNVEVRSKVLKKLCIACNMISEIDQSKLEMPNLEDLQICNNLLTNLDLSKIELSSLCQFDAGENKLVSLILPEDLSNLEYMDLQKNNIVSLDLSNIKMPKLKYLDLESNSLQRISLSNELGNLQSCFLNRNKLKEVNFSNCCFDNLQFLSFGYNKLVTVTLPSHLPSLEKLKIYSNQLGVIDMTSIYLPKLKILDAENNKIPFLRLNPVSTQLETIIVTRNYITDLDFSNINLSNLQQLSFGSNFVQKITFSSDTSLKSIKKIDATNNPFISEIPSNIPLHPSQQLPELSQFTIGIDTLQTLTLWILRGLEPLQRQKAYNSVQILPTIFNPSEIQQRLDGSWKPEQLTQLRLRQILTVLHQQGKTPAPYRSALQKMIQ